MIAKVRKNSVQVQAVNRLFASFEKAGAHRPYEELYEILRANGGVSQNELAKSLELAQPIISKMIRRLSVCGVVCLGTKERASEGRKSNHYIAVPFEKLDVERVEGFAEIFELHSELQLKRSYIERKYGELSTI